MKKKKATILYIYNKELILESFEHVILNLNISSFTFVYQVDQTNKSKVVLLTMKSLLIKYKEIYKENSFYNYCSELNITESFANSLEFTFLFKTECFKSSLKSFLTSLKLFCKSERILREIKHNLIKEFPSDETFIEEIETFKNVKGHLYVKSLYIGPNRAEILNIVYWELTVLDMRTKDNIIFIADRRELGNHSSSHSSIKHLILYNQDACSFKDFIKNKIAATIFNIKARHYFLTLGFNITLQSNIHTDFTYSIMNFVISKGSPQMKKYIKKFLQYLNKWLFNLPLDDFENLKRLIMESLVQRETVNHRLIIHQLVKWGFTVRYNDINEKIETYMNTMTLEEFKSAIMKYFSEDLRFN